MRAGAWPLTAMVAGLAALSLLGVSVYALGQARVPRETSTSYPKASAPLAPLVAAPDLSRDTGRDTCGGHSGKACIAGASATPALPASNDAERRLASAQAQSAAALARSRTLEARATASRDNHEKARLAAAAMTAQIQAAEADIGAAQARLAIVQRAQAMQAARLADEQQPVVQLTGMLQLLARKPAVSVLAQPGTIDDLVHARAILGASLPEIERRTAGLRAEMAKSRALKAEAELALKTLSSARERLAGQRSALARLEQSQRIQARALASSADLESTRAAALGEKARDIVELMESLRADAEVRADLAALDGPLLRPAVPEQGGGPGFASLVRTATGAGDTPPAKPLSYRLPVIGEVVAGLGEISPSGVRSRGLTIAAQSGAQVAAPAAGRIAFAGPYRGFGTILIIEHPGGWTSLITNMISTNVRVGDEIVSGAPIGRAGPDRPEITIELRKNGVPQDIVALVG